MVVEEQQKAIEVTAKSPPTESIKNQQLRAKPQWREAVAGACAGAVSRTLLAPVERVKLLKQLQGSVVDLIQTPNLSAVQVARKIYREEGVWAFWRGNVPNVLRVSGTSAIHFTCMDYYKRAAVAPIIEQTIIQRRAVSAQDIERRRKIVTSFISSGLAGATATTILYPIEFVRTRLAMDMGGGISVNVKPRQYNGMRDVMRSIVKSDGVLGFYQGYGIALVGGVVYRIILLGGYDAWKGELLFRKERSLQSRDTETKAELSWGERILSAQIISLTAGTISYPFDSVRRRMMMQAGVTASNRRYSNSIHCVRVVWNTEGLRGFYLGLGPNLLRSVGGALVLVGYDRIRTLL